MSLLIYLAGFVIVIAGVAWGLTTMGMATKYIEIICVILLGIGIVTAVTRTRQKDAPS